jgi:hypothetical protein
MSLWQVAYYIGRSPRSVRYLVQQGQLTPLRWPGFKTPRFDRKEVDRLFEPVDRLVDPAGPETDQAS